MTPEGKFVSIEDFRENATEEDCQELYNMVRTSGSSRMFKSEKNPSPDHRFQFSYSSAKKEADKWHESRKQDTAQPAPAKEEPTTAVVPKFDDERKTFAKRSVMVTDDHWNRLQKIFDKHASRSKHYVLHALLEEIISKYES